jgi:hypothetical protein
MCKSSGISQKSRGPRLLLTTSDFELDSFEQPPTKSDSLLTIGFIVGVLFVLEHILRYLLQDAHYLLEDEMNVKKVARHLGVDLVGLSTCAFIGLSNRHIANDLWSGFKQAIGWSKEKAVNNYLPASGYESRFFTYYAPSQHLLLVFAAYQLKNLYDSIIFDDGPEFIFHHVFSGLVAWSGMHPGFAHFYCIFFMGISEISTTILVMLSHFDAKFGIEGLDEAIPTVKVLTAVAFVTSFIICRTLLWPYVTYHFMKDAYASIQSNSTPKADGRRFPIQFTMFALSGVSVLQVLWLGQIFVEAKTEIDKILN